MQNHHTSQDNRPASKKNQFSGFPAPIHTQISNTFLDDISPLLKTAGEYAVMNALHRQTYGWHKEWDRISISQLSEKTGKDRKTVLRSTKSLEEKGYIEKIVEGRNGEQQTWYRLTLQKQESPSQNSSFSNNFDQWHFATPTSGVSPPTKETIQNKYKKKIDKKKKQPDPRQASESIFFPKGEKMEAAPPLSLEMRKFVTEDDHKKLDEIIIDKEEKERCINAAITFMDKMHHNAYKKDRAVDIAIRFYHKRKEEKLKSKENNKQNKAEKGKVKVKDFICLNKLDKKWVIEKDYVIVATSSAYGDIVIHFDDPELEDKLKKRLNMMRQL